MPFTDREVIKKHLVDFRPLLCICQGFSRPASGIFTAAGTGLAHEWDVLANYHDVSVDAAVYWFSVNWTNPLRC